MMLFDWIFETSSRQNEIFDEIIISKGVEALEESALRLSLFLLNPRVYEISGSTVVIFELQNSDLEFIGEAFYAKHDGVIFKSIRVR